MSLSKVNIDVKENIYNLVKNNNIVSLRKPIHNDLVVRYYTIYIYFYFNSFINDCNYTIKESVENKVE